MTDGGAPVVAQTAAVTSPHGRRRRRLPSPAEQARRVAWGHKFGPLAADAIKTAIQEAGRV